MSEYVVEFGDRPINDDNKFIHERVVRCRDCANHTYTPKGTCRCDYWMTIVETNGFCAWGNGG